MSCLSGQPGKPICREDRWHQYEDGINTGDVWDGAYLGWGMFGMGMFRYGMGMFGMGMFGFGDVRVGDIQVWGCSGGEMLGMGDVTNVAKQAHTQRLDHTLH